MLKYTVFALLTFLAFLPDQDAHAIPAFARSTGTNCTACHTTYPELNATGEMYKEHGFRFEPSGDEPWSWDDKSAFLTLGSPPIALRTAAYYSMTNDRSLTPEKLLRNSYC